MIWCLHGAVGMAADWKRFGAAMGKTGESVRRVDLWRYLDCAPMSLEEFGRVFCDEVAGAGTGSDVLVGYSMGGRLALHALLETAERKAGLFRAAVIVSAHPGLQDAEERLQRMARDAEWAGKALTGDWGRFLDQWEGQAVLGASPGEGASTGGHGDLADRRLLLPRRQAVARSFMDWSLGKQADLRERLRGIGCPVLWMTGARDAKFSRLAAEVVPSLPAGRHVKLGGAGHRLPWELANGFDDQVRTFLATVPTE